MNLSAVYFALKQYGMALKTIENIRKMGVKLSENTEEILTLREEACFEALKPDVLKNKENSKVDQNNNNTKADGINVLDGYNEIKKYVGLSERKHTEFIKNVPAFNEKLIIKEDSLSYRGVYAEERVEPGEFLMKERAYVSDLRMQSFVLNCYNCLKQLTTPVGCRRCSVVLFCDKKCEEESWNNGVHNLECEYFTVVDEKCQISK